MSKPEIDTDDPKWQERLEEHIEFVNAAMGTKTDESQDEKE